MYILTTCALLDTDPWWVTKKAQVSRVNWSIHDHSYTIASLFISPLLLISCGHKRTEEKLGNRCTNGEHKKWTELSVERKRAHTFVVAKVGWAHLICPPQLREQMLNGYERAKWFCTLTLRTEAELCQSSKNREWNQFAHRLHKYYYPLFIQYAHRTSAWTWDYLPDMLPLHSALVPIREYCHCHPSPSNGFSSNGKKFQSTCCSISVSRATGSAISSSKCVKNQINRTYTNSSCRFKETSLSCATFHKNNNQPKGSARREGISTVHGNSLPIYPIVASKVIRAVCQNWLTLVN